MAINLETALKIARKNPSKYEIYLTIIPYIPTLQMEFLVCNILQE